MVVTDVPYQTHVKRFSAGKRFPTEGKGDQVTRGISRSIWLRWARAGRESSDVAAAAVNDNETKRNQIKDAAARVAPGDLYCLQRRAGLSGVSGIVVVGTVTNPADGAYQIPSHFSRTLANTVSGWRPRIQQHQCEQQRQRSFIHSWRALRSVWCWWTRAFALSLQHSTSPFINLFVFVLYFLFFLW